MVILRSLIGGLIGAILGFFIPYGLAISLIVRGETPEFVQALSFLSLVTVPLGILVGLEAGKSTKRATAISLILTGVLVLQYLAILATINSFPDANYVKPPAVSTLSTALGVLLYAFVLHHIIKYRWRQGSLGYRHAFLALMPILALQAPPLIVEEFSQQRELQRKHEICAGLFLGKDRNLNKVYTKQGDGFRELLGVHVVRHSLSDDGTFVILKRAPVSRTDSGGTMVSYSDYRYYVVDRATLTMDGPFSEEQLIAEYRLDNDDPIFAL